MPKNNEESNNGFDFLKSRIGKLHIPLPNFRYFHKPSSEEEVFGNFIGREEISEQLEEWLENGDSGAYLVTGYRGMGKSSFVGTVLNKITRESINGHLKVILFTSFCLLFIISSVLLIFMYSAYEFSGHLKLLGYHPGIPRTINEWKVFLEVLTGISICGITTVLILDGLVSIYYDFKRRLNGIKKTNYQNHKTWFEKVYKIKDIKGNKHNLVIKLNLGHETLREKDILSLIAKRIFDKYSEYLDSFYTNWVRLICKNLLIFFGAVLVVTFIDKIDITKIVFTSFKNDLLSIVQEFTRILIDNETFILFFLTPKIIVRFIVTVFFYFIVKMFYDFVGRVVPSFRKHSTKAVLDQLKFLIERIESSVTESSGPNTGYTSSTSLFSFNFSRKKNKTYPYASTREIEDELIQILRKIQIERSLKKILDDLFVKLHIDDLLSRFHVKLKFHQPLKFIIVFDELDKIDPVYNQVVKTEQDIPEFETGSDFQGSSAIRNRKQNVLKLLGNMKLFMSQAKAKFVFISGRELYDAFLADLADREFAASSIFNGVVNVDSFLVSSTKQKNILTKTEEYICGYLIPKSYYIKEAKSRYKNEMLYRLPNLRMYKKFLIETMISKYLISKILNKNSKETINLNNKILIKDNIIITHKELKNCLKFIIKKDKQRFEDIEIELRHLTLFPNRKLTVTVNELFPFTFENFEEFKNCKIKTMNKYWIKEEIKLEMLFKNQLFEIEQKFLFIDRVIVFLNQFSFYLTHVCNGSPKKITLYFEQYIKSFMNKHPKNPFSECRDIYISEGTDYCLTFDVHDQQKIGFIYYSAYPIFEAIINKISHFGDKMLVSISFLIDHIFKHHKGGFSYENIEHTPELLEVYHIPNLRDSIEAIFSFLRQNYITNICGGVYQYKFRKFFADEIKYNSRLSGEISAIFNFTLDESLPIKRYYYKQIKDNEKKYLALAERINNGNVLIKNQYALTLASQLEVLGEIHLLDEEYNEAIQHYQTAFEIIKSEFLASKKGTGTRKDNLQLHTLLNRIVLKLGLAKEYKGYYDEALMIYHTLIVYLMDFRFLDEAKLGLTYFYEDNKIGPKEWKSRTMKLFHKTGVNTKTIAELYSKDNFYKSEVMPFFRKTNTIEEASIDFLLESDSVISGLSKMLTSYKQKIISRLTLFSEIKSIFQVILANLFVVEKIDHNGITQENLNLAEEQFKYIYLLTDSKDKFIQAADFYKKLASILFLKNYSNSDTAAFLQLWGFNIREIINEFCLIHSDKHITKVNKGKEYIKIIDEKFPKEILWDIFVVNSENLWEIPAGKIRSLTDLSPTKEKLLEDFISFAKKKWDNCFGSDKLNKCGECHKNCKDEKRNHPCYACRYVSKSLDVFSKAFIPKYPELPDYQKRKSFFFKLLCHFKESNARNNYFFILASALRIKADVNLSCVNGEPSSKENKLSNVFLRVFFDFLKKYYAGEVEKGVDVIIAYIEGKLKKGKRKLSPPKKLEKVILYYWLSGEYFRLNASPVDCSESLIKILLIFDKFISLKKELSILNQEDDSQKSIFSKNTFKNIQDTIIRRVLRNSNIANSNVVSIELQNLKYILRNRLDQRINLSNLSTTPDVEDVLFAYCKLELDSLNFLDLSDKNQNEEIIVPIYDDCYKSTLLSKNSFSFTMSEKILAMEFKAKMNLAIFESIVKQADFITQFNNEFHSYNEKTNFEDTTMIRFYEKYFNDDFEISFPDIIEFKEDNYKFKLIRFLIFDSLYCLIQITEALTAGRFSNFSNSFIGDIYYQISKWATYYEGLHVYCKEQKMDFKKIEKEVFDDIGTGNRHFLDPTYSVRMALRYYRKATEIHNDGIEYKEMIQKMYIIDDDISNGMQNFSLALERYAMNCGLLNTKIKKLKDYYKKSMSYQLGNYLKDTSKS